MTELLIFTSRQIFRTDTLIRIEKREENRRTGVQERGGEMQAIYAIHNSQHFREFQSKSDIDIRRRNRKR
jgi:hypothetical protein